jgi:broad specificity phosphatase PhoE
MVENGECSYWLAPVQRHYVCDEWLDINQTDFVHKSEQHPTPKYTVDPEGREYDDDEGLMAQGEEMLEPTMRGVHKEGGALYLISHGKTRYNVPGKANDRVQGWLNVPIDQQGRRQAAQLGKFLKGKSVDELHSSDIARARQTADIAARHTGLQVHASKRYRPWNLGDFAGHSSEEVIPKLKPYMTSQADRPVESGGESFNTFKDRFIPALEALLKKADAGKTVALITHSRNIELAQGWLAGNRKRINTRAITTDDIKPASVFQVTDGKIQELEDLSKAQAFPATVRLRVGRMHTHEGGFRSYGMHSREGHFVGRTMPTTRRALKGDTLSVNAAHFSVDPQGMTYWLNPVVEGQSPDAPHSWRQLEALAGAAPTVLRGGPVRLSDDDDDELDEPATDLGEPAEDANNSWSAPGPAGQIPLPGDEYNAQARIDQSFEGVEYDDISTGRQRYPGPTMEPGSRKRTRKDQPGLGQVHVDAPLQNIGVAYTATAKRNRLLTLEPTLQIHKADRQKQIVYGVVLEPNVLDTQSDFMRSEDVEKTAHGYLKKAIRGKSNVSKLQHRTQAFFKNKPGLTPVESFIAPCDFTYDGSSEAVKKGSWVLGLHVEDPQTWQDVMNGKYTGFSIGGSGIRQSMRGVPSDVVVPGMWLTSEPSEWAPMPRYTG